MIKMEYQFKDEIIKQIPNIYDVWSDDGVERRQDELISVYAKAKAYDKDKPKIEAFDRLYSRYQDEKGFFKDNLNVDRNFRDFGWTATQALRRYEHESEDETE